MYSDDNQGQVSTNMARLQIIGNEQDRHLQLDNSTNWSQFQSENNNNKIRKSSAFSLSLSASSPQDGRHAMRRRRPSPSAEPNGMWRLVPVSNAAGKYVP